MADVGRLVLAAGAFHQCHGGWPSHEQLLAGDPSLPMRDRWGRAFRFDVTAVGLTVRTAGLDGVFDSEDDIVSGTLPKAGW